MDAQLRAAERAYATDPSPENKNNLRVARRRAGWVKRYVPCNGCGPGRTVRYGGTAMLCPKCCGNGWTHTEWVPPEVEGS